LGFQRSAARPPEYSTLLISLSTKSALSKLPSRLVPSTLSMKPASRAEKPTTRIATFSLSGTLTTPDTS
jgi:hypothetical protein